jgi:hypothetical protein
LTGERVHPVGEPVHTVGESLDRVLRAFGRVLERAAIVVLDLVLDRGQTGFERGDALHKPGVTFGMTRTRRFSHQVIDEVPRAPQKPRHLSGTDPNHGEPGDECGDPTNPQAGRGKPAGQFR